MKIAVFLFLFCLINPRGAVYMRIDKNTNDVAINMLKDFYIAYNTAWSTTNGEVLVKQLDLLQTKYCTTSLRKELKTEFKRVGLDHDELINDEYTDVAHLNTLKVIEDKGKINSYIVSYIVVAKDDVGNIIRESIIIHITVAKENGSFKIAAVNKSSYSIIGGSI